MTSEFRCPSCGRTAGLSASDVARGFSCGHCSFVISPAEPDTLPGSAEETEAKADDFPEEWVILEKLGQGGMGAVYRARHRLTDELVALKRISASHAVDSQYGERFAREVKVLSQLRHPRLVSLLHSGIHRGRPWLAMELVEGGTLRQRVGDRSAREAVRLVLQIAEGLAYIHGQGVLHRDLKPENVLLTTGDIKITDFGLASLFGGQPEARQLTAPGATLGTYGYMAPEQMIDARSASPACDLYALGVMLFELLTGRMPHGEEAPGRTLPGVPAALDELVKALLAREPRARPTNAAEVISRLQQMQGLWERVELRVETVPSGACVTIDGAARGPAPVTVSGLKPGPHELKVEAAFFRAAERRIELAAGTSERLKLELEPLACRWCGAGFVELWLLSSHERGCRRRPASAEEGGVGPEVALASGAFAPRLGLTRRLRLALAWTMRMARNAIVATLVIAGVAYGSRGLWEHREQLAQLVAPSVGDGSPAEVTLLPGAGNTAGPETPARGPSPSTVTLPPGNSEPARESIQEGLATGKAGPLVLLRTNAGGYREYLNPKDGSELIEVPASSFRMGCAPGEGDSAERPQHTVALPRFFIGKYEVTNAQYRGFLAARTDPAGPIEHRGHFPTEDTDHTPAGGSSVDWVPYSQKDDMPAVGVSWYDCYAYCVWAGLELPTEAQWERAARGTDGRKFPWGNELPDLGSNYRANYRPSRVDADGYEYAAPVGTYGPLVVPFRADGSSPVGALDMAGNVAEWVFDWLDDSYYILPESLKDPRGPLGPLRERVLRGGSWSCWDAGKLSAAKRSSGTPGYRDSDTGFRVSLR